MAYRPRPNPFSRVTKGHLEPLTDRSRTWLGSWPQANDETGGLVPLSFTLKDTVQLVPSEMSLDAPHRSHTLKDFSGWPALANPAPDYPQLVLN